MDNGTSTVTPPIPSPDAIAAVRREPRFKPALAVLAADNLAYYQRRWLANRVLNDRARFGIALASMFLHVSYRPDDPASGLTAARFRDICVGAGLCGGGRAEGLLMLLRTTGFLERADRSEPVRRFVPTPKLIALHRGRNRQLLSAVDLLRGDTHFADRIGNEGESGFYRNFVLAMGRMFLAGYRMVNAAPELKQIADRDAGMPMMICALLASPDYAALVPEEMRPATVSDLARRFGVSRRHVRSVQRDAESAGLLVRHGDSEQVTVLPALIDAVESFVASALVMIESCARAAAAQEG
jgi:hypothetical protein